MKYPKLIDDLRSLPGCTVSVDGNPNLTHVIDVVCGARTFVIECPSRGGFGLSELSASDGYGEKPNEIFDDEGSVIRRLKELLGNEQESSSGS